MFLAFSAPRSKKARNRGRSGDVGVPNRLEVAVVGAHLAVGGGPAGTVATSSTMRMNRTRRRRGRGQDFRPQRSAFVPPPAGPIRGRSGAIVPVAAVLAAHDAVRGPSSAKVRQRLRRCQASDCGSLLLEMDPGPIAAETGQIGELPRTRLST